MGLGNNGGAFAPPVTSTTASGFTRRRGKNHAARGCRIASSLLPFLASGDLQNKKRNTYNS